MDAVGLNLESLAHRSFDEVGVIRRDIICCSSHLLLKSFFIEVSRVDLSGQAFFRLVVLKRDTDLSSVSAVKI